MNEKRRTLKKVLSVCLALIMVLTVVPYQSTANAASSTNPENLQFNQTKAISFSGSNNYKFYGKFTINKRGVVTIKTVDKKVTHSNVPLKIVLYNEKNKAVWGNKRNDFNSINPNFISKVGLNPGTYKLEIENTYRNNESIELTLFHEANQYCEIESNELYTQATPLKINQFYNVYFGNGFVQTGVEDYDWFSFTAEKDRFYRITTTNRAVVEPTTTLLKVYGPNGKEIGSSHFKDKMDKYGNNIVDFRTEQKGKHLIKIYNYGNEQIGFKLKVTKAPFYPKLPYELRADLAAVKGGHDDVHLSWEESKGATGYEIYMKKGAKNPYKLIGKTTRLYYNARNLADGAKYYFKMRPYYYDGAKLYRSNAYRFANIWTMRKLNAPSVKKYSVYSPQYVDVKWSKMVAADGYQISRSKSKTGTFIVKTTYGNSYMLKTAVNRGYYYKVRGFNEFYRNGKTYKVYAPWSNVKYYRSTR